MSDKFLNQIINENCVSGLKKLPNESCHICVCSPPYKDEDGFRWSIIWECFTGLYRVLKKDSLFFLNFGHLANAKFRPFEVCAYARHVGFELNDTIVWKKTQFSPIQGKKRVNNLTEFIFVLYKGKMPNLDRLAVGVPYKDKTNVKRYANGKDLRCCGNYWEMGYETIQSKSQKLHRDRFPIELPERCIKLSGIPKGSLCIDPFCGSASSLVAAKKLGMNYLGFEINKEYCEIGRKRLCG